MCHRYKLASLNWYCQLLPCFDGELNLIANEKCLSCQQWATWKHEIGRLVIQKLNILQARCDSALSCSNM